MSKWKCTFPPCGAKETLSRPELERMGWTFSRVAGVTLALCPEHSEVKALF